MARAGEGIWGRTGTGVRNRATGATPGQVLQWGDRNGAREMEARSEYGWFMGECLGKEWGVGERIGKKRELEEDNRDCYYSRCVDYIFMVSIFLDLGRKGLFCSVDVCSCCCATRPAALRGVPGLSLTVLCSVVRKCHFDGLGYLD